MKFFTRFLRSVRADSGGKRKLTQGEELLQIQKFKMKLDATVERPLLRKQDYESIQNLHEEVKAVAAETRELAATTVQQLKQQLTSANAQIDLISRNLPDGFVCMDYTGSIISANPAALQLFGYAEEEISGKPFSMLFSEVSNFIKNPETWLLEESTKYHMFLMRNRTGASTAEIDPIEAFKIYQAYTNTATVIGKYMSLRAVCKDGILKETEVGFNILKPDGLNVTDLVYVMIIRDVTDRNESMRKLDEVTQFNLSLIQNVPNPIFYKDKNFKYVGCNQAYIDMLEISREEIVGKTTFDISADEFWARRDNEVDLDLKNTGTPDRVQYFGRIHSHKTSTEYEVVVYKTVLRDAYGNFNGIVGSIVDLTAVSHSQRFKDTLLNILPTPVYWLDEEFRYAGCNVWYEKLIGMDYAAIAGRPLRDVRVKNSLENLNRYDDELKNNPRVNQQYEVSINDSDGSPKDIVVNRIALVDSLGQLDGVIGVLTDISEIRNEQRFQKHVFEALPYPVFYVDDKSVFKACNDKFAKLTGIPRDRIVGYTEGEVLQRNSSLRTGQEGVRVAEVMSKAITTYLEKKRVLQETGEESAMFETHLFDRSTDEISEHVCYMNAFYEHGIHRGTLVTLIDVSHMRSIERNHSAFVNSLPHAVFFRDQQGFYTECNQPFCDMLGLPRESIIGKHKNDIISHIRVDGVMPPDSIDRMIAFDEDGELRQVFETKIYNEKSKSFRNTIVNRVAIRDNDDVVTGVSGILIDVTDLRQAFDEISVIKTELESILDASPDLIFVTDLRDEMVRTNRAAERFLSFHAKAVAPLERYIVDQRMLSLRTVNDRKILYEQIVFEDDISGKVVHDVIKVPLINRLGEIRGVLTLCRDVTNLAEGMQRGMAFAAALDEVKEEILIFDNNMQVMYINQSMAEFLEVDRDELLLRDADGLVSPNVSLTLRELKEMTHMIPEKLMSDAVINGKACTIRVRSVITTEKYSKYYVVKRYA